MIIGPISNPKKTGAVRVWIGELPERQPGADTFVRHRRSDPLIGDFASKTLAVELKIAKEPRVMYGLLGAQFDPRNTDFTEILIPVIQERGAEFLTPLAPPRDRVWWHYPEEFALATKKAVLLGGALPPGVLEIKSAACADAGSSRMIFSHLTRLIIRAISDNLTGAAITELAFDLSPDETYSTALG